MFLNPALETKKAYTPEFGDSDELVGSFPLSRRAFRRENRSEFVPNTKTGTKFWIGTVQMLLITALWFRIGDIIVQGVHYISAPPPQLDR